LDAPEIIVENPDGVLATWRNVVIAVWRVHTRVDALLHLEVVLRRFALTHQQIGLFQVLEPTIRPLDSDQRDVLDKTLRGAGTITSSSVLYEGSGFQAAAVRAVVAAVRALRPHAFPHRVFADMSTAIEFHAVHLRHDGDFVAGLENAIALTRGYRDRGKGDSALRGGQLGDVAPAKR
jgi:hypothetical protein